MTAHSKDSIFKKNKRFQKNLTLWSETCPKEAVMLPYINTCHLTLTESSKGEDNIKCVKENKTYFLHDKQGAKAEASQWFSSLSLDNISLVFIFGVGLGFYYDAIKDWLKNDKSRYLVFLENDLAVIHLFLESERAEEILKNPQVQVLYFEGNISENTPLDSLYWHFSMKRILFTYLKSYRGLYSEIGEELQHKIAYDGAMKNGLVDEYLRYGVSYYVNFYKNMLELEKSYFGNKFFGSFHKVPAIICGAGPSLAKNLQQLPHLMDKALVFAGGSALNVLNSAGIQPHFGLGIDPNPAQYTRMSLNKGYEVPFFYRNRMCHDAFKMIHGPRLYISGSGGYDTAEFFEKNLGLEGIFLDEGHNVVNFCVEIAAAMGCDPLIFVGMDLAFTGMDAYAPGVVKETKVTSSAILNVEDEDDKAVIKKDIFGNPTYTLWKWVAESEWLSDFAKSHSEVTLINSTEGGIGFEGVENQPLKGAIQKNLKRQYEFKNRIHGEIQNSHLKNVTLKKVKALMNKLSKSLQGIIDNLEILKNEASLAIEKIKKGEDASWESGRGVLAESDLMDELAYKFVISIFNEVYARVLSVNARQIKLMRASKKIKQIKMQQLALSKFDFILNVAKINKELMLYAFSERKKVKKEKALPVHVPHEKGKSVYTFKDHRLYIVDEALSLFIDEKWAPVKLPKKLKNGEKLEKGHVVRTFLNTNLNVYEAYIEKEGVIEGEAILYYPDGKIKQVTYYKKGQLHGPSRFYSEEGGLLSESWFIEGLQEGKCYAYYPSSHLYSLHRYKKGLMEGLQEFYHEDGGVKTLLNYRKGTLMDEPYLRSSDGTKAR